jgi:hypothetical protein
MKMKRRIRMKRLFNVRSLILTIALLLAAIPVAANDRPFSLNGTGVGQFITNEAGLPISANVTGSGTATHLGSWTTTGTVHYGPPDADGLLPSSGEATIIAANGDRLNAVVQGRLNLGAGMDSGTFTFVGGTGRFAAASGSASFVVTVNPITGGFELTVVGRINY